MTYADDCTSYLKVKRAWIMAVWRGESSFLSTDKIPYNYKDIPGLIQLCNSVSWGVIRDVIISDMLSGGVVHGLTVALQ